MKTIWKTALELANFQTLRLPAGAELLTVQMQHGYIPTLWAAVDPKRPLEDRHIAIYGTGFDMPDVPGSYIGTVQESAGGALSMVWHVFEIGGAADGLETALTGNNKPTPDSQAAKLNGAATWAMA